MVSFDKKEHFNQHHEQTYAGSWAQMHILFRSVKKIIVKYYVMEMDKIVAERIYSESMAYDDFLSRSTT